jgi:hypothetical protein
VFRATWCLAAILTCTLPTAAQVEFRDAADRDALRRWFVLIADAQFYREPPEVTDCAALVRHAVREALRSRSPEWLRQTSLPPAAIAPALHARAPQRDGAWLLFRVDASVPPRYAEFADARTLIRLNANPLGRDLGALLPGDLLYFRDEAQHLPDHLMVFVGPSAFEADGDDWVVYHTGPSGTAGASPAGGEVRKARLRDLLRHPSPRWRPVAANPHFVGVFRLSFFPA